MSVSLLATLALFSAATDSVSGANAPSPELATLRASQEAVRNQLDALDQKIKVLERLRENDKEDAAAAAKAAVKLQANASGLWIRSADSAYSIRFRGQVRNGANWDLNDENKKTLDQFQNTTVRFGFDGVIGKGIEYKINSDWSKGSVALQDAFFDVKLTRWLKARTGKFQVPLGLERCVSPTDLLFYDRAFPSQIAPNRDVGAQLFGGFASDRVQYSVGVFNGGADASNINNDVNDDKDLYARLWVLPLKGVSDFVGNLGIGFGANAGYHDGAVPAAFKTNSGSTFFSWKSADTLEGLGYRLAPQAQWSYGPFLAYGEWIQSVQDIKRGTTVVATDSVGTASATKGIVYRYNKTTAGVAKQELSVAAWQTAISWVISGEDASDKGVVPRHPF
ncbi:MAG: porin, partial [Fibrobacterota bacterium]